MVWQVIGWFFRVSAQLMTTCRRYELTYTGYMVTRWYQQLIFTKVDPQLMLWVWCMAGGVCVSVCVPIKRMHQFVRGRVHFLFPTDTCMWTNRSTKNIKFASSTFGQVETMTMTMLLLLLKMMMAALVWTLTTQPEGKTKTLIFNSSSQRAPGCDDRTAGTASWYWN